MEEIHEKNHESLSKEEENEPNENDWIVDEEANDLEDDASGADYTTVEFNRPTEEVEMEEDVSVGATVMIEEVETQEEIET